MAQRPPLVMWVQGLENLRTSDFMPDNSGTVDSSEQTEMSQFLFASGNNLSAPQHSNNFFDGITNIRLVTDGVVDFSIDEHKVRLVTERLGNDDTNQFIINAPRDTNIVITVRPKYMTKKSIEQELTETNRVSVNIRMPRLLNIFDLIDKNNWSKECVAENVIAGGKFVLKEFVRALIRIYLPNPFNLFN